MQGPFHEASAFVTTTQHDSPTAERFAYDKFMVNQKTWSLGNKYYVYNEANQPLCFVDRPVFKLKANIGVYEDDTCTRKLLTLRQDTLWAMNYIFTLLDERDQPIAAFKRHGWLSLLRRTWQITDATGGAIAQAQEDSWAKAILRRLPYFELIGAFIRTNFIVTRPDGQLLGEYIRRYTIADKHVLDLTADTGRTLDRRIAVGLSILLDNVERRR